MAARRLDLRSELMGTRFLATAVLETMYMDPKIRTERVDVPDCGVRGHGERCPAPGIHTVDGTVMCDWHANKMRETR